MNLFLLLTSIWVFSMGITSLVRYAYVKDKFETSEFVFMTLGTYVFMWILAAFSYLLIFIFKL